MIVSAMNAKPDWSGHSLSRGATQRARTEQQSQTTQSRTERATRPAETRFGQNLLTGQNLARSCFEVQLENAPPASPSQQRRSFGQTCGAIRYGKHAPSVTILVSDRLSA